MGIPEHKQEEGKEHWAAWYMLVLIVLVSLIAGFYLLKNHFA